MHRLKPLTIGNLEIKLPLALGPMAGVTDLPFRTLSREQGCGLFYTEMVSAKALYYGNSGSEELMRTGENEHPIGVQLFGSDPDIIAGEALKIEDRFDFIDFNLGCPVPKIVKNGEGSFLLTKPELVEEIFTKLCKTVHKPVTAKIRKGFTEDGGESVEIAQILEHCGVSMSAVHGRTREQYYSGRADWEAIRRVKEAVKIPVLGNGDVFSAVDAERMLAETGVDGVMVARGAEGNPWIFREIREYLSTGVIPERPSYDEVTAMILRHAEMLIEEKGSHIGVLEMRKHASWYLAGAKNATKMRRALNEVTDLQGLRAVLEAGKAEA